MSQGGRTSRLQWRAVTLLLLLPLSPLWAGTEPRFASLNVCADQLLLMLADREEIASVSYHAADPNFSFHWRRARGLSVNRGQAEELIAAQPSLVLGGTFSNPATQHLLDRLGIAVLPLDVPTDFAGIRAQILAVAEALGHRQRGQTLAAELDRRLSALRPVSSGHRPLAAVYQENGISAGRGTLVGSVVEAAGFENLATGLGLAGYAALSLEELVLHRPSLLVTSLEASDAPSLARQTLEHPALKELAERAVRVTVPAALWVCPGPYTIEAVELIARERAKILAGMSP